MIELDPPISYPERGKNKIGLPVRMLRPGVVAESVAGAWLAACTALPLSRIVLFSEFRQQGICTWQHKI